jgi:hypothetical protein
MGFSRWCVMGKLPSDRMGKGGLWQRYMVSYAEAKGGNSQCEMDGQPCLVWMISA